MTSPPQWQSIFIYTSLCSIFFLQSTSSIPTNQRTTSTHPPSTQTESFSRTTFLGKFGRPCADGLSVGIGPTKQAQVDAVAPAVPRQSCADGHPRGVIKPVLVAYILCRWRPSGQYQLCQRQSCVDGRMCSVMRH
jgi:hypothetical protein